MGVRTSAYKFGREDTNIVSNNHTVRKAENKIINFNVSRTISSVSGPLRPLWDVEGEELRGKEKEEEEPACLLTTDPEWLSGGRSFKRRVRENSLPRRIVYHKHGSLRNVEAVRFKP